MLDEVFDFAAAAHRLNKTGLADQGLDLLLITGEAEKQVQLITPFQRFAVDRALRILGLMGVVLEFLAGHAVPTLLAAFDDVSARLNPRKKLLDDLAVPWIRRANQAVVADLPAIPELSVLGTHTVAMGLRGQACRLGRALNLLAVLITAGDEQHLLTLQSLEPGQGIAGQGRVRAPQVGLVVDVVEGCGEGVSHRRDPTQPFPIVPSAASLGLTPPSSHASPH